MEENAEHIPFISEQPSAYPFLVENPVQIHFISVKPRNAIKSQNWGIFLTQEKRRTTP